MVRGATVVVGAGVVVGAAVVVGAGVVVGGGATVVVTGIGVVVGPTVVVTGIGVVVGPTVVVTGIGVVVGPTVVVTGTPVVVGGGITVVVRVGAAPAIVGSSSVTITGVANPAAAMRWMNARRSTLNVPCRSEPGSSLTITTPRVEIASRRLPRDPIRNHRIAPFARSSDTHAATIAIGGSPSPNALAT